MKTAKARKHGFSKTRLNRIGDWMQRYVDQRKYAGSSILIARNGREIYANAVGERDIAAGLPFTRDTVARIYSMSKPITSVGLMMLAERGLCHLSAPVSDFLPEFSGMEALIDGATRIDQSEPCATPSLHQLLTHTSGMSYAFNPGVLGEEMAAKDVHFHVREEKLENAAKRAAALPLAFRPGTRWEYSIGIDIVGRVIEVVAGKPLDQFLAQEIFEPLGMSETAFTVAPELKHRFAALYTPLDGNAMDLNAAEKGGDTLRLADAVEGSDFLDMKNFSGGGGLTGTIDDYMRFVEMLRKGGRNGKTRLLSPSTVAFMRRNHLPGDIASMGPRSFAEQPMEGMGFGLGGSVVLNPGLSGVPGSVGDFSWGGMASTFFWTDPVHDLSVVFFTQLSPSSSYPSRAELKALIHGAMIA